MMIESGAFYLAQEDGGLPTTLAAGSAPGESGVSVLKLRFQDGFHFSATPQQLGKSFGRNCTTKATLGMPHTPRYQSS